MADNPTPQNPAGGDKSAGKALTSAEVKLYEQVKNSLKDINIATEQGREKFRALISTTKEWNTALGSIVEDLENIDDNFGLLNSNVKEIGQNIANVLNKELEKAGKKNEGIRLKVGEIKKLYNEVSNSVRKASDLTQEFASGNARTKDISKQIAQNNKTITQLIQQATIAKTEGNTALQKELSNLIAQEQVASRTLKTLEGQSKQLDKASGLSGKFLDGFKKIPLIGEVIGEDLAHINDELREEGAQAIQNNKRFNMLGAGISKVGSLVKKTLSDPLVLTGIAVAGLVKAFGFLKKLAFEYSEDVANTQKNYGMSEKSSKAMVDYTKYIANNSHELGVTSKAASEAMLGINESLGTSAFLSAELVEGQTELVKKMGLTQEEAAGISKYSILTGKSQDDIQFAITSQNKGLLNNKAILKEVAKTEGQLAAFYKNDPALIGKAVIQAQKLGLTLEKTKGISDALLDIESSLSNEYEAEALIGKDINLNQARFLAMQGDTAGAAEEVLKNVGGINEFMNMNRIQQDALAKSMGMSTDELANSLTKQAQLSKLSKDQKEQVQKLRDAGKEDLANKILAAAGDEKAVRMADMQVSAHEKLADAGEKFQDAISTLVAGPLGDMVSMIGDAVGFMAKIVAGAGEFIKKLGGIPILGSFIKGLAGVGTIFLAFKALGGFVKFFTKGTMLNPMIVENVGGAGGGGGGGDITDKLLKKTKLGKWFGNSKVGKFLGMGEEALEAGASKPGMMSKIGGAAKSGLSKAGSFLGENVGGASKLGSMAKSTGSFFGKIGSSVMGGLSKAGNFVAGGAKKLGGAALESAAGPVKGALKTVGKFLGPIMAGIEGISNVAGTISDARAQKAAGQTVDSSKLGKDIMKGAAYPIANLLTNLIPGVGQAISLADSVLGAFGLSPIKWLSDHLIDWLPDDTFKGLGDFALGNSKPMAEGGIVTGPTKALVGEAGAEAVVPLKEFYAKIDELIGAVRQGGNIYLDGAMVSTKLQTPMAIATRRTG